MIEIPLTRGFVAVVDDEDEHLSAFNWYTTSTGPWRPYARRRLCRGQSTYLHRDVLGILRGDPRKVDHLDGNTLDCRRANLRVATHSQNMQNIGIRAVNRSGFTGVWWSKSERRWKSYIDSGGKRLCLGTYESLDDAKMARAVAEVREFGIHPRRLEELRSVLGDI